MGDYNNYDDYGVFFATEYQEYCAENMLTGSSDDVVQSDRHVTLSSGHHQPTFPAVFLPYQQMNAGEFPYSGEIIFHDLENVVKSSGDIMKHTTPHCLAEAKEQIHEDDGDQGRKQKRKLSGKVHNLNERRRRQKFQDKITALQELIPNCDKRDKGSIIDKAMKYIKTLESQVQLYQMMMSMAPMVMMHQRPGLMQIPTLAQFPPFYDLGIGHWNGIGTMGMGMGIPTNGHPGLIPESAHYSSIENYPGWNYVLPPWHETSFPASGSQGATSPSQGTTTASVLPSRAVLARVGNENRSSHSGSSERDTSSSIAKFQGYP